MLRCVKNLENEVVGSGKVKDLTVVKGLKREKVDKSESGEKSV